MNSLRCKSEPRRGARVELGPQPITQKKKKRLSANPHFDWVCEAALTGVLFAEKR